MRVAPNHVLVGESAITLTGEPRVQGGPGSSVRVAHAAEDAPAAHHPPRRRQGRPDRRPRHRPLRPTRGSTAVQAATDSADVWDVDNDGYADAESGHGTFIAGLILQVAPAAEVYIVKVLDSHGVGDDATVAKAMEQLPQDVDIVNLSLGGYTMDDAAPLAIACALNAMRKQRNVVVAAAGNAGKSRPFWPAAFKQVLAVGAVDEKDAHWQQGRLQQLRLVGRRRRARREPAVDVHQGQDQGRDRAQARSRRPVDRLRRLGGVGRHVVRVADHRRRCSPARCRATGSRPPPTRRRTCSSTSPPAPQPRLPARGAGGRTAALDLDRRPGDRDLRAAQRDVQPHDPRPQAVEHEAPELVGLHATARPRPAARPSRSPSPAGAAGPRGGARAGRSPTTSSSIPSRGDSKLNCRGPLPPRTSAPASSSASALSRISSASSASTVRQVKAARAAVVEQRRNGVQVREDRAQLGFGGGVVVGHSEFPPVGGGDAFTLGQPAQALQAPCAGRPDAPDRHVQRGRDLLVARRRIGDQDAQQRLAALREPAERLPQRLIAFRRQQRGIRDARPSPSPAVPRWEPAGRSGAACAGTPRRAVVASHAPTRSGSCRRPRCSTRRSQVVCTTSEASAVGKPVRPRHGPDQSVVAIHEPVPGGLIPLRGGPYELCHLRHVARTYQTLALTQTRCGCDVVMHPHRARATAP